MPGPGFSEGRFVGVAAGAVGGPRVGLLAPAAVAALIPPAAQAAAAGTALVQARLGVSFRSRLHGCSKWPALSEGSR